MSTDTCLVGPGITKTIDITAVTKALDITTDILSEYAPSTPSSMLMLYSCVNSRYVTLECQNQDSAKAWNRRFLVPKYFHDHTRYHQSLWLEDS